MSFNKWELERFFLTENLDKNDISLYLVLCFFQIKENLCVYFFTKKKKKYFIFVSPVIKNKLLPTVNLLNSLKIIFSYKTIFTNIYNINLDICFNI